MKKLFYFILLSICSLSALSAFATDEKKTGQVCVQGVTGLAYVGRACLRHSGTHTKDCKNITVGKKKYFTRAIEGDMLTIFAVGGKTLMNYTIGDNLQLGETVQISGSTLKPIERDIVPTCK